MDSAHEQSFDAPNLAPSTSDSHPRVTRSSARLVADSSSTSSETPAVTTSALPQPPPARTTASSRKRKAAHNEASHIDEPPPSRRAKKAKLAEPESHSSIPSTTSRSKHSKKAQTAPAMSSGHDDGDHGRRHSSSRRRQPSPPGTSTETSPHLNPTSSRRRSSRKKSTQGSAPASSSTPSTKRSKKSMVSKELDIQGSSPPPPNPDDDDDGEEEVRDAPDEEKQAADSDEKSDEDREAHDEDERMAEDDPFSFLGRDGAPSGLSNTLRALSGMMSGMSGRLRGILENLRTKEDPSVQLIALTELSEILLVSNEDNLAGHFSPDQFVKELVALMQPNIFGEENPEMMLLACRCIANLMEAVPSATASVVYGGAVPILCQKLLEIHFIDLAEQALSTLEKISVEYPSSIVREGGLTACLTYLDFFATSTQRTAVTTAANCCRNVADDSFPVVRDVMPILLNVLSSNDQKVVEQGSLCVCRLIESFRWQESKLEELVSPDLLRAIIRLLLPGTTNLIGQNIHTQFLRVLAIVARASPRLSIELLRINVVDTLYQILTGVSPPAGTDDIAIKIDKNIIMQALIRSPKDQVFETLNVICELLPAVHRDSLMFLDDLDDAGYTGSGHVSMSTRSRTSPNDKRLELFKESPEEVKRFALVLFPTLMHAYTSTVNLNVRQKVLTAQLKMLSNFDIPIIEAALRGVSFASHLASIMSQQESPMLVTFALQIAELLLKRLPEIYNPQFYREGVMAEIVKLSQRSSVGSQKSDPIKDKIAPVTATKDDIGSDSQPQEEKKGGTGNDQDLPGDQRANEDNDQHNEDDDDEEEDSEDRSDDEDEHGHDDAHMHDIQDIITKRAQKFVETYGQTRDSSMPDFTSKAIQDLQQLAADLRTCYVGHESSEGRSLFKRLAQYFSSDTFEGITSYELLTSGIVDALLSVFSTDGHEAHATFLQEFMTESRLPKIATGSTNTRATAFSVLIHKLQDLLSRTEHFEVITVHHNAFESNRSSAASMLAKQLRLKLYADDDSGIPKPYRNIMVSIHAIATFRALDDYLRPRISLAERPRKSSKRDSSTGTDMAAAVQRSENNKPGEALTPSRTNGDGSTTAATTQVPKAAAASDDNKASPAQLRRSSRRLSPNSTVEPSTPKSTTKHQPTDAEDPLECADEKHISDDEASTEAGMDTIVDDLDEADEEEEDSPVNMEVANTGKVTARKEDGTRVSTPLQGSQATSAPSLSASARLAAARQMLSTPSSLSRPMSYALALQAIPQDWHIEFSANGQPISNDTTIYRAVHFNQTNSEEVSNRLIWSALHKITFKRVPGPPPAESSSLTPPPESQASAELGLPPSLSQHPQTASILQLMSILHNMNANLDDIIAETPVNNELHLEPLAQFVNTKLTAKLNRQMEEPLIVASNCLPSWAEDLARLYPFLFPFETRHLFLQSTSFGYSRSMARWQSGQPANESRRHRDERPFLGRTQRQKVRIARTRIFESALKVMEIYGSSPSILEVEYFDEVGTGLGPTLEFYSVVSKEFSKKKLKLWRENESEHDSEFAFGKKGLFPAPMSSDQLTAENGKRVLQVFRLLGKFVARSMLDSRIIDVSFGPTFFRIANGHANITPSLGAIANVDQGLANSLKDLMQVVRRKRAIDEDSTLSFSQKQDAYGRIDLKGAKLDDLGLDFTLPGYPSIDLIEKGSAIDVTIENVEQYIEAIMDLTLGSGVRAQIQAFKLGFSQVFPYSALKAFTPDELVMLFGRNDEDWSLETLMDSIKADHGFNLDSQSVRNLLHTMSEYTPIERRDFLQFVSGSPKLPIGGFRSLTPMFTVVCKPAEPPLTSDEYLPSVMTCVNYLKLPDYSSIDVLKAKLRVATQEGQGAFHLS